MGRKVVSVSMPQEDYEWLKLNRYSPSELIQEAIQTKKHEVTEEKQREASKHPSFVMLKNDDQQAFNRYPQ